MTVAEGSVLKAILEPEPQRLRETGCSYEAIVRTAAARILADASEEVDTMNKEEREAAQKMLAFYRTRRAKLDTLISAIEDDLGEQPYSLTVSMARVPETPPARLYANESVYTGAIKVLAAAAKPLTTMEIAQALLSGGYHTTSKPSQFNNTVYARLFTAHQKQDTFERLPSQKWALRERQKASA